jgi:hypothetical protein
VVCILLARSCSGGLRRRLTGSPCCRDYMSPCCMRRLGGLSLWAILPVLLPSSCICMPGLCVYLHSCMCRLWRWSGAARDLSAIEFALPPSVSGVEQALAAALGSR